MQRGRELEVHWIVKSERFYFAVKENTSLQVDLMENYSWLKVTHVSKGQYNVIWAPWVYDSAIESALKI